MADRPLRSNFPRGSSHWALRRAQWHALGYSEEDMEKPKIAVVNTSSGLSSCFSHLDEVARRVSGVIRAAGALALEIRTAAPSDFITSAGHRGSYILSARDLIANEIEVAVEGAQLDGMLCLSSCDKTTPGHLMAAARLDVPSLVVFGGYQPSGEFEGEPVDAEDVFHKASLVASGKVTIEQLAGMADNAIRGPGVCSGMGTANSMHTACEALGMSLPGGAPVAANSDKMWQYVEAAGRRIVEMVNDDLRPRMILTEDAFANAVMAVLAVSGSINCVKHLQAVATEAQSGVDVHALFDRYAGRVPVVAAVRPIGDSSIEQFEAAGAARGVLKSLSAIPGLVRGSALTVSGRTLAENLEGVAVADENVIRPVDRPYSDKPSLVIVRGSLAPEGGIVKLGVVDDDRVLQFEGPARVYESADDAMQSIDRGEVKAGDAVVIRGLGVVGGPGMGTTSRAIFALDGADLGDSVAVITDGQLSGLVNRGLVVGEVSPEAAVGGPLAAVEEGDIIAIDAEARTIDLKIGAGELERRLAALGTRELSEARGWLGVYRREVQSLARGAVITRQDQ